MFGCMSGCFVVCSCLLRCRCSERLRSRVSEEAMGGCRTSAESWWVRGASDYNGRPCACACDQRTTAATTPPHPSALTARCTARSRLETAAPWPQTPVCERVCVFTTVRYLDSTRVRVLHIDASHNPAPHPPSYPVPIALTLTLQPTIHPSPPRPPAHPRPNPPPPPAP